MKIKHLLPFLLLLPLSLLAAVAPEHLAVGDWVFRAGIGQESALIRYLDDGAYSHIGIVVAVTPEIRIVHATTDDDPAHPNQVIASSFAAFTDPRLAGSIAAARPAFLAHHAAPCYPRPLASPRTAAAPGRLPFSAGIGGIARIGVVVNMTRPDWRIP